MRKSYIANSSEALNLHNGSQTAIVVAMKVQPVFSEDGYVYNGNFTERYKNDSTHEDWRVQFGKDFSPYALGQEVYVREAWYTYTPVIGYRKDDGRPIFDTQTKIGYKADDVVPYMESPATMPKSAARTRFKIVSCEAVRVWEMTEGQAKLLCLELYKNLDGTFGGHGAPTTYKAQFEIYAISEFGQTAWDENHFIWYYKIENI